MKRKTASIPAKNQVRTLPFEAHPYLPGNALNQVKKDGGRTVLNDVRRHSTNTDKASQSNLDVGETSGRRLQVTRVDDRCLFTDIHFETHQQTQNVLNPNIAYRYLIDPVETRAMLADFAEQEIIGLDTETYYDFRTQENRLSLLQLAAPNGAVVVIDALAAGVEAARGLIENPQVVMAAHNARFDDGILRGSGFEPAGFVDTLRLARRTLRLQSYGLASVADHLFGMTLDKSHQRSDWRKRPLSRAQLDYAALDAQAALQVFQTLTERLKSQGRLESELKRARLKRKGEEEPKPTGSTRGPELRPLTSEERIIFERLCDWREGEAKRARLPLYMICYDKTLEQLAINRPRTLAELDPIYGLGPARIAKYGEQLLACLI